MSGQMRWSRGSGGMEHPDDSMLLAYTRQQSLDEGWSGIHQHIDTCKNCHQRCIEYAKINAELTETLEHFQCNQYYPSLTENVFEFIHNPAAVRLGRKQRGQKRGRRYLARGPKWVSFVSLRPILVPGVVLLLLFLLVAIVLARGANWSYIDHNILHQGQNGIVLPSVPTVLAHTLPSPSATAGATGTATSNRTPTIRLCTTSTDKAQSRIRFCGANFTAGDKVRLIVYLASGDVRIRHAMLVDAQGHFQDFWVVINCKEFPTAINVEDEMNPTEVSLQLRSNQMGHCSVANPMPTRVVRP